ncbi:15-hydroxyprostaglandin dehydrogenase [NAD(+)]-like isoform X2 [Photinus pyralis]|nr:15-hydroxyprostaglandin dehydrogenase [NAD(+)]-like isoform X2 [Photinus pyralis]XP_031356903.1 15-hydroxyprostaglandin dehydrogenase [NAD(+)]-like isoform X2 [Photinus pyralis]XP_031356905.1 15-hydroxyprostaglandin dehydrogenase [NAD(+)]-like isoform X2 [Photinus pyralis]
MEYISRMMNSIAIPFLALITCASTGSYDFNGKIALVTGGNRGIGLGITTQLLRNGVKGVTMVSVNETRGSKAVRLLTEKFGSGKVIWLRADVSDERELEEAFNASIAHWGALDIVVNNAGVSDEPHPVRLINVNSVGVVQGTILGFRYMSVAKGGRGGVVVNVASIYGIDPSLIIPVYSGTKAFVIGLGRSFGSQLYYNHNKVRVMTVCPGVTNTDLISDESIMTSTTNEFLPGLTEIGYVGSKFLYKQTPDNVGKAVVVMLNNGDSGSVWVSEYDQPPYEVEFPDRKSMKKSSFIDQLFD